MTPTEDLYNRLNRIVQYYNKDLFSGALPPLVLTLQRNQKSIATFDPDRWGKGDGDIAHELSINSSVVTGLPLIELFKVVVHHMTICWQHVYGNPSRKGYCNKELANKLIEIGLQPTSTGMPGGAQVGQNIQSYPIVGGRFLISSCRLLDTEKWRMSWVDLEVREPGTNALSWMDNFSAAASYDDQIAVLVKAMPDANIETLKSLTTFRLKEIVAESALRLSLIHI